MKSTIEPSRAEERQTVLLLGGSGMLGTAWRRFLRKYRVDHWAPTRQQLDLTDRTAMRQAISRRFRYVVNCTGYTDVDRAEVDRDTAMRINGSVVGHLASACAEFDTKLIHYSTDYVFNGNHCAPYPVDGPIRPNNHYGATKAKGEDLIVASDCDHLTIRTSWLYAAHGKNFLLTMLRLMEQREIVRVVDDQLGRPTSADCLVEASFRLLKSEHSGMFHVCNQGQCSWFQFASAIQTASRDAL